jgi:hypothetical protein
MTVASRPLVLPVLKMSRASSAPSACPAGRLSAVSTGFQWRKAGAEPVHPSGPKRRLPADPPSWANLFLVAESFDEFRNNLQTADHISLKPDQVKRAWIDQKFLRTDGEKKKS